MSIKDLIQSALNGSASEFEQTFSEVMSQKMEDAVGAKYDEMFEEKHDAKKEEDDDDDEEDDDELEESKALLKDYEDMKAKGKKDSNIIDVLMSMPKYKKMTRDKMAKTIGDAKRKGVFKEEVFLEEEDED
jgi:membrane-associated HD superfamily phosphohydrolase